MIKRGTMSQPKSLVQWDESRQLLAPLVRDGVAESGGGESSDAADESADACVLGGGEKLTTN